MPPYLLLLCERGLWCFVRNVVDGRVGIGITVCNACIVRVSSGTADDLGLVIRPIV